MSLEQAAPSVGAWVLNSTYVAWNVRIFSFLLTQIVVLAAGPQKLAALHATGRQRVQNFFCVVFLMDF
jgi:hypothetical protein